MQVTEIRRLHDQWLDGRARSTGSASSFRETRRQFAARIETLVGQSGSAGLNSLMDRF